MNFSKADELKVVAVQIFGLIKEMYKHAKDDAENTKEDAFASKYANKDVVEQLNTVLEALAGSHEALKWPEEEANKEEEGKKDGEENKNEAAEGEEAKEGGDKDELQFDGGAEGADAKSDFCKVFLNQIVTSPVLFDAIKAAVLSTELDSLDLLDFGKLAKGAISFVPGLPKAEDWAGAAAILSIMVNNLREETKDKEIWGKMRISSDDMDELKEAIDKKDDCALIFPGLTIWHAEESGCPKSNGPEANQEITFKVKNSKYHEIEGKFAINRYIGKIDEWDEEKKVVTLSEKADFIFEKYEDWKKKFAETAVAAKDAVEGAKDEANKEGDEKKEEENKDDK